MNFNYRSLSVVALAGAMLVTPAFGQNFYSTSWMGEGDSLSGGTNARLFDTHSGPAPVSTEINGSITYTDSVGGDIQLSGSARARSTYLNQGTYASASITNAHSIASGNPGQYYQTAAIAGYTSAFTIFGPSLVETDVFTERFNYTLEGTTQPATGIESSAFIYTQVGTDSPEGSYISGNTTFSTALHTFKPGVSNFFQLEMDSWVNFDVDSLPVGANVSATTDFYHTLKLSSVDILDSNGNAVKDFEIVDSNSGQKVYGAGSLATPEPCTLAVIGLGSLALLRRRRDRSQA